MQTVIKIEVKNVYGVQKFYPANRIGQQLAAFKNQTTLTQGDVNHLKAMGFTFEVVHPEVSL